MTKQLLTIDEVSGFVRLSKSTLAKLRVYGTGPDYVKVGRTVLYNRGAVDNWLEKRTFGSTSQYSRAS